MAWTRPTTLGVPDDLAKWVVRESGLSHARLVPDLWEWAMAWPSMWTALKPLETDKFRSWLQRHGISYETERHMETEAAQGGEAGSEGLFSLSTGPTRSATAQETNEKLTD